MHVTDLSQTARGAAASLHSSSFYLGQAIGPVIYGFGFAHGGPEPTILFGAWWLPSASLFQLLAQGLSGVLRIARMGGLRRSLARGAESAA